MDLNPLQAIASSALAAHESSSSEHIKSACFTKAMRYRHDRLLEASDCDCVGFTALHWAVLCNKTVETKQLIKDHPPLVNTPSQNTQRLKMWHMTPLFLAAMQGHIYLTSYLLTQKADPTIYSKRIVPIDESIIKDSCSIDASVAIDEAARRGFHEIVLLLIKLEVDSLLKYEELYGNDNLSTCCCIRVGSTKIERINALKVFQESIQGAMPLESLKKLSKEHPSIKEGRLGTIYEAFIAAKEPEFELDNSGDTTMCALL
jgi:ankyrin repeat protein